MLNMFPRTTSKEVYEGSFTLDMEFLHKVAKIMYEKGYDSIDTEMVEDLLLAAEKVINIEREFAEHMRIAAEENSDVKE